MRSAGPATSVVGIALKNPAKASSGMDSVVEERLGVRE